MGVTSCTGNTASDDIQLQPEQFTGLWAKENNTYEYWRFNNDLTGVTWDETPDSETGEPEMTEEESNLKYYWKVDRNLLMFRWEGLMENQNVPRYYYIRSIDSLRIVGEDDYGLSFTLIRK